MSQSWIGPSSRGTVVTSPRGRVISSASPPIRIRVPIGARNGNGADAVKNFPVTAALPPSTELPLLLLLLLLPRSLSVTAFYSSPKIEKMDMECETTPEEAKEESGKSVVVILVGAPGSGKSTFCEDVMRSSTRRPWVRVCQDTIGKGKAGTKAQCLQSAVRALKDGKSVFIDRCNLDKEQRAEFVKLGTSEVDVHAVVLDLPAKLCISRSVKRTDHEGSLQGGKAAAVVNRMLQKKELPNLSEGFSRITLCQNENDVRDALNAYIGFGPLDTLPSGFHGQKNPDAKVQLGIMKFLKKAEVPMKVVSDTKNSNDSASNQNSKEVDSCSEAPPNVCLSSGGAGNAQEGANLLVGSDSGTFSPDDIPTLAFPSISTSDFQFNLEKASDIIVEKVKEFTSKLNNARLVLVDLSPGSRILSLVRSKASQKSIDSKKFFTFVGDITRLYTEKGLRCNAIANAANWRLKAGGGGVNAAIYNAAGPALDVATKEQAGSLLPGKAVVVPLPSCSPLFSREGVTHVIHVLGPNMNPHRPNFLNNDYTKGCDVLRDAYSSLFEGFISLLRTRSKIQSSLNLGPNLPESGERLEFLPDNPAPNSDDRMKREAVQEFERNKKYKAVQDDYSSDTVAIDGKEIRDEGKANKSMVKSWGSWAQALYKIAMHPENYQNDVLEISDDIVVTKDLYPKAQKHILVLARSEGLDSLADVQKEHLQLLRRMHSVGLKWAEKFLCEDASLVFRLGYHSVPSMRQLHLHVISQDFNSKHLKNKKHWNSFNTAFFRDSVDVIEEIINQRKATLKDERLLSMELRCHRCKSAHPNIPRLKSHIGQCKAPFPSALLQNGRLVQGPSKAGSDP